MHRKLRASCATFILAPPLFDIFLSANQPVGDGATGFVAKFHTRYRLRDARRFFVRVILSGWGSPKEHRSFGGSQRSPAEIPLGFTSCF